MKTSIAGFVTFPTVLEIVTPFVNGCAGPAIRFRRPLRAILRSSVTAHDSRQRSKRSGKKVQRVPVPPVETTANR
jgi:hypothetical protein